MTDLGQTRLTEEELADRIDKPPRIARYELANKAEVKAFVDGRIKKLAEIVESEIEEQRVGANTRIDTLDEHATTDRERILELENLVAELRLTVWRRVKRWCDGVLEELVFAVSRDPSVILPYGSQLEINASDKQAFAIERMSDEVRKQIYAPMPTEQAEDLETHPALIEAIEALEGKSFHYSGTADHLKRCRHCNAIVYAGQNVGGEMTDYELQGVELVPHVCATYSGADYDISPEQLETLGDPNE